MKKWNYSLINGQRLRELINSSDTSEENCEKILKLLVKCYNEINKGLKLDEGWFDNEKDEVQDDIDCAAFDKETIDYHLRNFYDTCDQLRVWVSI